LKRWIKSLDPSRSKREVIQSRSRALEFEPLQALGYVEGSYDPDPNASGVVLHDEAAASPGYNLYSSRNQSSAQLIDMQGREIHRWNSSAKGKWQHVELLPDGRVSCRYLPRNNQTFPPLVLVLLSL
jgi:hypothetical protein